MKNRFVLAGVLFCSSTMASAAAFNPPTQAICAYSDSAGTPGGHKGNGIVDKSRLATWALNNYAVSRGPEDWLASQTTPPLSPTVARMKVLPDENFCKSKNNPNGLFECSDEDRNALDQARLGLISWLSDPGKEFDASGVPPNRTSGFISDVTSVVRCVGETESTKKAANKSSIDVALTHLRIRGSVDVLRYDQQSTEFKSVSNASFAVNRDDVNDKTTDKTVGVLGYQILDFSDNENSFEAIPYIGINRNLSSSAAKGASTTANTRDVGISIDGSHVLGNVNNVFILRPDYLTDVQHHDQIVSVNATYMPIVTRLLNVYFPLAPGREHFASLMPIFDLRFDSGNYHNCRVTASDGCHDYSRVGSQFGFSLLSDNENVPISLNVTDTRLVGLTSQSHDIDYVKAVLSFALNKSKTVTLDLGFSDGRREDTALEEKLWSVSFGVKY